MTLEILASAKRDLDEGYWFYERQREGLGSYFRTSVAADIESLRVMAGIHPLKYRDYHRMLCHIFPFAIYYTKIETTVTIYAVVDCRSDPASISDRFEK